jgi:hypothetical protein
LSILFLCMKNHTVLTIEGRRGSVKGKGKLHAVGVEYGKYIMCRFDLRNIFLNTELKVQMCDG